MSFETDFKRGYRAARFGYSDDGADYEEPAWQPGDTEPSWSPTYGASVSSEDASRSAAKDAEVATLRTEIERLHREQANQYLRLPRPPAIAADKLKMALQLAKRAVASLHPDTAGPDRALAAALEHVFKELRSAIERMERGA